VHLKIGKLILKESSWMDPFLRRMARLMMPNKAKEQEALIRISLKVSRKIKMRRMLYRQRVQLLTEIVVI
jgi:hypothetical protein